MDPNANLEEQRVIAQTILDLADKSLGVGDEVDVTMEAERLAELVQALDAWISGGGFLPEAWRK